MTRRDWWLGVLVLAAALVVHALFPRYEVRTFSNVYPIRVDRWTGTVAHAVRTDRATTDRDELADFLATQK